ncbi:hypothetical protein BX604_7535 [Burkholderia sp. JKS000303]|nr:hypothetical protein BX604_7535 [Burkholderia sp. JKS000303]
MSDVERNFPEELRTQFRRRFDIRQVTYEERRGLRAPPRLQGETIDQAEFSTGSDEMVKGGEAFIRSLISNPLEEFTDRVKFRFGLRLQRSVHQ